MTKHLAFSIAILSSVSLFGQTQALLKSTATTQTAPSLAYVVPTNEAYSYLYTANGKKYAVIIFGNGTYGFQVLGGSLTANVLLVGGGGAGGTSNSSNNGGYPGGGGGGEVLETTITFEPGNYTAVVGAGGVSNKPNATNGGNGSPGGNTFVCSNLAATIDISNSYQNKLKVFGGRGGQGAFRSSTGVITQRAIGSNGGSGGGVSSVSNLATQSTASKATTSGRANNGGTGSLTTANGAGGGGAGGAGQNGTTITTDSTKNGGVGVLTKIFGVSNAFPPSQRTEGVYVGGGGGGSASAYKNASYNSITMGGQGAYGTTSATVGESFLGEGGGGGKYSATAIANSGAGGSGCFVISYEVPSTQTIPPIKPPVQEGTPDPLGWGMQDYSAIRYVELSKYMEQEEAMALDTLCIELKENNIWDSLYAVYPFVASRNSEDLFLDALNLKSPIDNDAWNRLTLNGQFLSNQNGIYSSNGSSWIETHLNIGSINKDSVCIGVYSNYTKDPVDSSYLVSAIGASATYINTTQNDSIYAALNCASDFISRPSANGGGLSIVYRNVSDTLKLMHRNMIHKVYSPSVQSDANVWLLGAKSDSLSSTRNSKTPINFAFVGGFLSDEQVDSLYQIIQRFQQRLSRRVGDYDYLNKELNELIYTAEINDDTIPSLSILTAYDNMITSMKSQSVWDSLHALYVFQHDGGKNFSTYNVRYPNEYRLSINGNISITKDSGSVNQSGGYFYSTFENSTMPIVNNSLTIGASWSRADNSINSGAVLFSSMIDSLGWYSTIKADSAYVSSKNKSSSIQYPYAYNAIRAFSITRNQDYSTVSSEFGYGQTTNTNDTVSLESPIDGGFKIFDGTTIWNHALKVLYIGKGNSSLYANNIGTVLNQFERDINPIPYDSAEFRFLIVAGGGGGGYGYAGSFDAYAGGGGGGGVVDGGEHIFPYKWKAGLPLLVTVGEGGTGSSAVSVRGTNGGNSSIGSYLVYGGGGGGSSGSENGLSGGSGGGAAARSTNAGTGGSGTSDQGNAGGSTAVYGATGYGGGGGGSGNVGTAGGTTAGTSGVGGAGKPSAITTGTTGIRYGGGGGAGGGASTTTVAGGGSGGGGAGASNTTLATAGTDGFGGGGGGGADSNVNALMRNGAGGGRGVVYIRTSNTFNKLTVSRGLTYTVTLFSTFRLYTFVSGSGYITIN